ncbi:MAG: hypothetical protein ACTSQF_09465 [Candidatus Heimdallarchaeaceae archaeon]
MAIKPQLKSAPDILAEHAKILYDFEFTDEESYSLFLQQLLESLQGSVEKESKKAAKKIYEKTLEEELRNAKDKIAAKQLLLFGSLYSRLDR